MSIATDLHFILSIIKTEWKNTFSSFIIKNSHHISSVYKTTFKTHYTFTSKYTGDFSCSSSSCKLERGTDVAACTKAMCVFSVSACTKFLPHRTQSNRGLLAMCLDTICVFRLPLWLKFLPHTWQINGFSAVWVTEWAFTFPRVVNRFPQTSQT